MPPACGPQTWDAASVEACQSPSLQDNLSKDGFRADAIRGLTFFASVFLLSRRSAVIKMLDLPPVVRHDDGDMMTSQIPEEPGQTTDTPGIPRYPGMVWIPAERSAWVRRTSIPKSGLFTRLAWMA